MMGRPRWWIVVAVALTQLVVATAVLGFRWVTSSTEVPVTEAVERFREGAPPVAAEPAEPEPTDGAASPTQPTTGVYRFTTSGSESAAGVDRALPDRSVRLVTREDATRWTVRHEYSAEHTEWFALGVDERGLFAELYRLKVTFGPFTVDETVEFEPTVRLAVFPFEVDQRWTGGFEGGSFTGRTFEHTTMSVGDEILEVWGIEVAIDLDGEIEGTLRTQIWYSPRHAMPVKESYAQDLRVGRGTYQGSWTITMLSTVPER